MFQVLVVANDQLLNHKITEYGNNSLTEVKVRVAIKIESQLNDIQYSCCNKHYNELQSRTKRHTSYNECSNLVGTLVHIVFFTNPSMRGQISHAHTTISKKRFSNCISKDGHHKCVTMI